MKIKILYLLITIFLIAGCAAHSNLKQQFINFNDIPNAYELVLASADTSLPDYEKLTYEIKWLGMPVGTLTASIKGTEKINGRDTYILEALFKTNSFCSSIYSVEDRYVSYMDKEKLYTLRHEVYRREGRYKKDAITDFDQVSGKAHFRNLLDKTEKVFDIPEKVQDFLSAYYFCRLIPLKKVGDKVRCNISNNERNYQVIIFVKSESHIKMGSKGKKKALLVQPYALLGGEKIKEGSAQGYYSCEGNRLFLGAIITAPVFTKVTAFLSNIESS